ncbi:MAG: hypothetical protein COA97_12910 [Flavobacteriales bacterium]|nr:MAG: hypothetical protein COA97_12910 [Flavobacteriales bacterium]
MDIQADINWIRAELKKVQDPHLIEAFKQLLTYRNEKKLATTDGLAISLAKALADKKAGRVKPHNEIRSKYEQWL